MDNATRPKDGAYLYPQAHDVTIKFLFYVAFSRTRNLVHACVHYSGQGGTFAKPIRQKRRNNHLVFLPAVRSPEKS